VTKIDAPVGVITNLAVRSTDFRKVAFAIDSITSPSVIYELDLETKTISPFEATVPKGDSSSGLSASVRLIKYKSFDQKEIPAFVYDPPENAVVQKNGGGRAKIPVMLYIHGGPASQYRPR
jgi:dipeptidyl aminopeptidase/acylaminoacyl peptidase